MPNQKDLQTNEIVDEVKLKKKKKIVSILSLLGLILIFTVIWLTVGNQILSFIGKPEEFRAWAQSRGFVGQLALVGIMMLQVVISVMPGEVVEIGAGYAFGSILGTVLCLIGAGIGSAVIFFLTKRFGISMVEAFVDRDKINSLKFINSSAKRNLLVFILFLIPGSPKDLMTYFIGLTPMKLSTFLILSSIARIPSVISSAIGGEAIGSKQYQLAIIVFAVTALFSAAGILVYRHIVKHSNKGEK